MSKDSHCVSTAQLKQAILLPPAILDCSPVGKICNADKGISNNVGTLQLAVFPTFLTENSGERLLAYLAVNSEHQTLESTLSFRALLVLVLLI